MNEQYEQGSENGHSPTAYLNNERLLVTIPEAQLMPATGADVAGHAVTWEDAVKVFLSSGALGEGRRAEGDQRARRSVRTLGAATVGRWAINGQEAREWGAAAGG